LIRPGRLTDETRVFAVVGTVGKRVLANAFAKSVETIEARVDARTAQQDRRGPGAQHLPGRVEQLQVRVERRARSHTMSIVTTSPARTCTT
jgi:hypothetical protein